MVAGPRLRCAPELIDHQAGPDEGGPSMAERLGRRLPGVAIVVTALGVVLVGTTGGAQPPGKRPLVLTTVAPLTNLAKNVAGPFVDVRGLIPEGTDSHTFEPAPSDVQLIAGADLVILNGLDL